MSIFVKVLLAEDDLDDQAFFTGFLMHRTDIMIMPVAENGVVLMDKLDAITDIDDLPGLIILDQNMPKRNGLQTLQMLKTSPRYTHIPVIVYSTYIDQRLIDACTAVGACSVIAKPITKDGYNDIIDTFLKSL